MPQSSTRITSIDTVRAVAMAAVICVHVEPFKEQSPLLFAAINQGSRFAVPFFFIASGYLFTRKLMAGADLDATTGRFLRRILVVFVAWSAVYLVAPSYTLIAKLGLHDGLLRNARGNLVDALAHPVQLLLVGTAPHLWFLPSLMMGIVILAAAIALGRERWLPPLAVALYLVGLLAGSYSVVPIGFSLHTQSIHGPFFSTLFVAIGWWLARHDVRTTVGVALAVAAGGLFLHFAEVGLLYRLYRVPLDLHNYVVGTIPFAIGTMLLALARPGLGAASPLPAIGRLALGIYVAHPLIRHRPIMWIGPRYLPEMAWQCVAPLLVYALALLLTFALSRVPRLRLLVQ
ncbi:MAG TPA: acyltransferase [bacterium]|jgi:surface polysaccharide O-acyltransferase-like enzyme